MNAERRDDDLAGKLKHPVLTLQIIVVALASGVVIFAVVAVAIRSTGEPRPDAETNLLTWMAICAAPLAVAASWLLPVLFAGAARAQIASGKQAAGPEAMLAELGDAGLLYGVYQTKTIVGAAVLEGAAFFSIMAFLLEGMWIAAGVGVGLAGVILTMFPSATRAAEWVHQQLRRIDEDQMLGR